MGPDAIAGHGVAGSSDRPMPASTAISTLCRLLPENALYQRSRSRSRRSNMASRYSPPGGNVTSGRGSGQARGASRLSNQATGSGNEARQSGPAAASLTMTISNSPLR